MGETVFVITWNDKYDFSFRHFHGLSAPEIELGASRCPSRLSSVFDEHQKGLEAEQKLLMEALITSVTKQFGATNKATTYFTLGRVLTEQKREM